MLFAYQAYTRDGAAVRGALEAGDEREASRLLLAQGLYAKRIAPAPAPRPLRASARAALYRELGALLGAGLTLDRALALLAEQLPDAAAALERLREGVRAGRGLAQPLAELGAGATAYERAALASAERSASLPAMLTRLADYLEAEEEASGKVRSALIYPCFVLTLGIIVAAVMLGVVVPKTSAMLQEAGMALPASSRWLVQGARLLVWGLLPTLAALLALFAGAKYHVRRHPAEAPKLDRLLLRLPGMGPARLRAAQRFASVLGMLLESGMTVPDALPLAAASTGRPFLEEAVRQANLRVQGGESPARALSDIPVLGPELTQWLRVGEAGGCLPAMLSVAAGRLGARADRALSARLALLEPSLLAAVGLFTLALALALLLPVLNLTRMAGI